MGLVKSSMHKRSTIFSPKCSILLLFTASLLLLRNIIIYTWLLCICTIMYSISYTMNVPCHKFIKISRTLWPVKSHMWKDVNFVWTSKQIQMQIWALEWKLNASTPFLKAFLHGSDSTWLWIYFYQIWWNTSNHMDT